MKWYLACWAKSFEYTGRASRNEFWHFILYGCAICLTVYVLVGFLLAAVSRFLPSHSRSVTLLASQFVSFVYFIHVFPIVSVQARRLHDIGKSGWWQLVTLLALFSGICLQIALQVKPASAGVPGWFWVPLLLLAACYLFLLVLNCKAGDKGTNRYGPPPR